MARRLPIEYEGAFCHVTSRGNDRKWERRERAKGVVISSTGERTKVEFGIRAKGRKVLEGGEAYRLREPQVSYPDVFGTKNADIGAENSYFWNINPDIST